MCNDIDNDEAFYDGYDEEQVLGFSESNIVHGKHLSNLVVANSEHQ